MKYLVLLSAFLLSGCLRHFTAEDLSMIIDHLAKDPNTVCLQLSVGGTYGAGAISLPVIIPGGSTASATTLFCRTGAAYAKIVVNQNGGLISFEGIGGDSMKDVIEILNKLPK